MSTFTTIFRWLAVRAQSIRTDRGASLVEYALLVSLIALVCWSAVQLLSDQTSSSLSRTASLVTNS